MFLFNSKYHLTLSKLIKLLPSLLAVNPHSFQKNCRLITLCTNTIIQKLLNDNWLLGDARVFI